MTKIEEDWKQSTEYKDAYFNWARRLCSDYCVGASIEGRKFETSQEFRNARLAFKKRVNGRTKADH